MKLTKCVCDMKSKNAPRNTIKYFILNMISIRLKTCCMSVPLKQPKPDTCPILKHNSIVIKYTIQYSFDKILNNKKSLYKLKYCRKWIRTRYNVNRQSTIDNMKCNILQFKFLYHMKHITCNNGRYNTKRHRNCWWFQQNKIKILILRKSTVHSVLFF